MATSDLTFVIVCTKEAKMPSDPQNRPVITGQLARLDVKRLQLRGLVVSMRCPACDEPWVRGLVDRISYPVPNVEGAVDLGGCCHECGHEWSVPATLRLSVELVEGPSASTEGVVVVSREGHRVGADGVTCKRCGAVMVIDGDEITWRHDGPDTGPDCRRVLL